ncbi:MAG TPA: Asp-tRNA(Asn)/Glu-tRNA(Gln) amidotransferase subunit GatA [Dehalococcoidia bacterium]|jgi:aspartyl-tRNA(Asn)/glutamyl-tRNA(Gln) amidotransferase subunit A|nr:Asp-tRNA(Asn)/Glu-tRNA(Gln) amidotransferase subunit GatA [Dehalococcoidia bacterium]
MPDLHWLTIHEAADGLAKREFSSRELTEAILARATAVDADVRAYIRTTPEFALEQAAAADKRLAAGERAPLLGVPVAIKDLMVTKGIPTTCGSKMLEDFVPPYDGTVVRKLFDAGAVMAGKTNMDEFAMGSSTENSAFFPTRNPWDRERVPGGSSGGSSAAVAAGEATYALGSDTGGSIRQPAALCGVVGMKPTYGRVSRFGLVAFASSLDQIGPFTRDVRDCAIVLNAICGHDPCDSTSAPVETPDFTADLEKGVRGMRIGVPKQYMPDSLDPGVRRRIEAALESLRAQGAEIDDSLDLPSTEAALAVYYVIAPSEASANLARYDGVKYGFSYRQGETMWENMEKTRGLGLGAEVKRRIMIGTYALSSGYYDAYYLKAQKVRTVIRREFDAAFEKYDAIVSPVTPTPAFKLGEKTSDPYAMYLNDVFTLPVNIAGLPGISVPAGFVDGLPVGLQVIGKPFDEATVLRVAHAYEQTTDWRHQHPAL